MSYYKLRSDFFEMLSGINKKVAHGRADVATGDIRRSFFRLNNSEEALEAVVDRMHLPCVIHADYNVRPLLKDDDERVQITNELIFLAKPQTTAATDIELAYELAENTLQEFIQWMLNSYEEDGSCGPFKMIDLSMFSWNPVGPVMQGLYGFSLAMREEQRATELTNFNANNWY